MTEQQIQSKRIKQLEDQGYYVLKLIKTNKNGIPDIIAIPPNTDVIFSEVKTPKGKLSKLQEYRLKELEKYGFRTEVYRGYLKEEGEVPLIIDLEYVDVNEYLDAILINNTIKSYYDEPRKKEQDY